MAVLPADMLMDSDLNGKATLAFCDLHASRFAFFDLAAGAVVRRDF
jgi:prepilin-type processing-associated H-X9-DG protein